MKGFVFELEEYKEENRYRYGRGLVAGTSVNLSPAINVNWNQMSDEGKFKENIENPSKILNLSMKITKILKKVSPERIQATIAERFLDWLKTNEKSLRRDVIEHLWKNYRTLSRSERPTLVIFKFQDDTDPTKYLYPGEIEIFREIYVNLSGGQEGSTKGLCSICGSLGPIIEGGYNYGCFTLDQKIFRTLFITDQSGKVNEQFNICPNCLTECQQGYNILESQLKFYAYSIKIGRDQESIYHYLIPQGSDIKQLKKAVDFIAQARSKYNKQSADRVFTEIKQLKENLTTAEAAKRKDLNDLKKRIKKLEKDKERYEKDENTNISPLTLMKSIEKLDLSFIDLYFRETNLKLNPRTKEVIDIFHLDKSRIKFLAGIIEKAEQTFNVKEIHPWWLRNLVGKKRMINYLQAFYNSTSIDRSEFNKISNKELSRAWLYDVLDISNLYYSFKMKSFRAFDYLFEKAQLFN